MRARARLSTLLAACLCMPGADSPAQQEAAPALLRARIAPSVVRLAPGSSQRFKVVLRETRLTGARIATGVRWAVNDIPGGNDEVGRISPEGVYQAPATTPKPREVHICADVPEAANRRLYATVLMEGDGPSYEMIGEWSEPIGGNGRLKDPHGIALDRDGNLLITDFNGSRVHRFTPEGKFLGELGIGIGEGPGYIIKQRVVQCDRDGFIFVSDQKKNQPRIQVFTHDGKFVRTFAEKGVGPGQLLRAHGLAFDSQQRLYVVDVDAMRVNVYEHSGAFVRSWGKDGPEMGDFNAPHGIAVDANDDVFVVGYYGPCQKFTSDGKLIRVFAEPDPPDGAVYFHSVSTDRWGDVYLMVRGAAGYGGKVEDNEGNRVSIMKYNNNGDYVTSLTLNVKGHAENWAVVDRQGVVYAIFVGSDRMGVERFAPR